MTTSTTQNKRKKWLSHLIALFFWLAVWQLASTALKQEILLASPVSVALRLKELIFTGQFWYSVCYSFVRIVAGFLSALALGVLLGAASYASSAVCTLLAPLLSTIKATPVASIIILCLIWIPSRNLSVFISFLIVLPVIYTNVLEGLRRTDQKLLEMAAVFRISFGRKLSFIYLSQLFPYLLSACTISLGISWKAGIAAEVIGIPSGSIGEQLYNAKVYLNTPDLFAWTVVIIALSFSFEKCFLYLLRLLIHCLEKR